MSDTADLYQHLRKALLACVDLSTPAQVHRLFGDPRLLPWRDRLPDADSPADRADAILSFLFSRNTRDGDPALALLVEVLRDRLHPEDAWYERLAALDAEVAAMSTSIQAPQAIVEVPFQVPPRIDRFVGRGQLIERVKAVLRQPGQICVVRGLGGVGKTALAIELGYQLRPFFADGVLWANLDSAIQDSGALYEDAIMSVLVNFGQGYQLDFREETDLQNRSRRVTDLLARKRALVVLDNAHGTADVEYLLPRDERNCSVLITTRNRRMLPQATHVDLDTFEVREGLALLRSALGEERVENELRGAEEILSLLGGLPLAVSIAAGDLAETPLSLLEYHELLLDERDRLEHLADWEDASKSVRASFELSFRRLPRRQQEIFTRLGLFGSSNLPAPTFDASAAAAITNLSPALLKKGIGPLMSLSLVTQEKEDVAVGDSEGSNSRYGREHLRFRLHRLLRIFAREKLRATGASLEALMHPATAHYAAFADENSQAFALLDRDWDNILASLNWARQHEEWKDFLNGLKGLTHIHLGTVGYMHARGYWKQAMVWLQAALNRTAADENSILQATLHLKAGAFALRQSLFESAEEHLSESLRLLDQLPKSMAVDFRRAYACDFMAELTMDRNADEASSYSQRALDALHGYVDPIIEQERGYFNIRAATILGRTGRLEEAKTMAEKGVDKLRALAPTSARISGYLTLGNLYFFLGKTDEAVTTWQKGRADAEALGDRRRLAGVLVNLANAYSFQGHYTKSTATYEEAAELFEKMGDVDGESHVRANLSNDYMLRGEDEKALQSLESALELTREHDLRRMEAYVLVNRARLQLHLDEVTSAHADLEAATKICEPLQYAALLSVILRLQARLALREGQHEEALQLIEDSLEIAVDPSEMGRSWRVKGQVLSALNRTAEATNAFEESRNLLTDQERYELGRTLLDWGRHLLETSGRDAVQKLEQALAVFEALGMDQEVSSCRRLLGQSDLWSEQI